MKVHKIEVLINLLLVSYVWGDACAMSKIVQ